LQLEIAVIFLYGYYKQALSPGAAFVSIFLGIALLIIGIEIIATGRRMQMMPSMGK
jgi:hypothetical protein